MKNPHVIWASVVIIIVLMAGAVGLSALNKDATSLISLLGIAAIAVLGALGAAVYQKQDQLKEMVNGNYSQLMDLLKASHEREVAIAKLIPPVAIDPATVDAGSGVTTTTTVTHVPNAPGSVSPPAAATSMGLPYDPQP